MDCINKSYKNFILDYGVIWFKINKKERLIKLF